MAVLTSALLAAPMAAQEVCEAGLISRVEVETNRIFDPEDSGEAGALVFFYRIMNAIHVVTRESYIRSELFFEEGDCFDQFLIDESERVVRALEFISTAEIIDQRQPDGTYHIRVVTRDAVSIKLSLGITVDDGFNFENVGLTEINLLGRGATLGIFRREQREVLEKGVELGTPRAFGSPLDVRLSGGSTRDGTFLRESVMLPFLNERSTFAGRQSVDWANEPFAYSLVPGSGFTHVLLPIDRFKMELISALRWGEEGGLFWLGGGLAWEAIDSTEFPDGVELVRDKDFPNPVPAPDTVAQLVASQAFPQNATRLTVMASRRDVVFTRRRRLDAVDAVQDVRIGTEVVATFAPAIDFLRIGDHPSDDVYGRLEVFASAEGGPLLWTTQMSVEGRLQRERESEDAARWQDVLVELEGVVFWQPAGLLTDPGRHTVMARLSWDDGQTTTRPYQLTLGGRDGVRGYSRDAFPGGRRAIITLEDRIFLGWPNTQLFDVGATIFADFGRMWAQDAPFGVDSGWKGSVGLGLRLASPAGSDRTTRIEFTFPFDRSVEADPTYFRFYVDLGGVLRGFTSEQMQRSRFSGVSSDLVNRPRRGR
jgi:hypothetical protein